MKKYTRLIPAVGLVLLTSLSARAGHAEEEGDPRFHQIDANGDGRISRAEYLEGVRATFAELDANRDGQVTADEVRNQPRQAIDHGIRFSSSGPAEETEGQLNSGAARADGSIPPHEVAAARARSVESIPTPDDFFRSLDRDGDGRLSVGEHESAAADWFTKLDADGDGWASKAEWEAGNPGRALK